MTLINTYFCNSLVANMEFFSGTFIPLSWSPAGNINKDGVYTDDGEDIMVENNSALKNITPKLLHKKVKVFGQLLSKESGYKVFRLEHYEIINDNPEGDL